MYAKKREGAEDGGRREERLESSVSDSDHRGNKGGGKKKLWRDISAIGCK